MRDHLSLAEAEVSVLDAGHNRDIVDAVLRRPLQRCCRRPVLVLAGANLHDDVQFLGRHLHDGDASM